MDPRQLLRDRPMSRRQMGIVLICICINMIDGYDILSLAQAAPVLARQWGLSPEHLGALFSTGLAGMAIGALAVSPIADQSGRRPAVLICLVLMSTGMALAASSGGFWTMAAGRLVTGIGIGGMTSTAGTLALEYASTKRRELAASTVAAAFPVGTIIGGAVAIAVLGSFGWRGIFWTGALLSALLLPLAFRFLPESLDFLLARQPKGALATANRVLSGLDLPAMDDLPPRRATDAGAGSVVREIAGRANLPTLVLLCCAHAMNMFAFYFILNWSPIWVSELTGSTQIGISYSIYVSVGGIVGGIATGAVAGRLGVRRMMLVTLLSLATLIAMFGLLPASVPLLVGNGVLLGAALFGSAAVCWLTVAYAFPPQLRATGLGIATTAGRLGSIFGPLTAGYLLAAGLGKPAICLLLALPAVGAALTFARARRVEPG